MATVRVMYWKEIPIQVQAEDDTKAVSIPLDDRFQQAADAISMMDGSAGTDEYLSGWQWSKKKEVDDALETAALREADRINRNMPEDFVKRIRDMYNEGTRNPSAGAIDHWMDL